MTLVLIYVNGCHIHECDYSPDIQYEGYIVNKNVDFHKKKFAVNRFN